MNSSWEFLASQVFHVVHQEECSGLKLGLVSLMRGIRGSNPANRS